MPTAAETPVDKLRVLAEKMAAVERTLNRIVIGQPGYTHALVTALAAGENVALISPPGTAKSYLVKNLARLINGRFYQALLNPYITYDELFGPLDVEALTKGEAKRKWSNIVRSELVFLDEGFKANPALLNTLLSFLNERVVYDPFTGTEIKVPLITAVVASNEVPEDPSLQALWDRFAVRVFGDYIKDERQLYKAYKATWSPNPPTKPLMSIEEVKEFNTLIEKVLRDPSAKKEFEKLFNLAAPVDEIIYALLIEPAAELMNTGTVTISNRTLITKWPKLFLANMLLYMNRYPPSIAMVRSVLDLYRWQANNRDEVDTLANIAEGLFPNVMLDLVRVAERMVEALKHRRRNPSRALNALSQMKKQMNMAISMIMVDRPLARILVEQLKRDLKMIEAIENAIMESSRRLTA